MVVQIIERTRAILPLAHANRLKQSAYFVNPQRHGGRRVILGVMIGYEIYAGRWTRNAYNMG